MEGIRFEILVKFHCSGYIRFKSVSIIMAPFLQQSSSELRSPYPPSISMTFLS